MSPSNTFKNHPNHSQHGSFLGACFEFVGAKHCWENWHCGSSPQIHTHTPYRVLFIWSLLFANISDCKISAYARESREDFLPCKKVESPSRFFTRMASVRTFLSWWEKIYIACKLRVTVVIRDVLRILAELCSVFSKLVRFLDVHRIHRPRQGFIRLPSLAGVYASQNGRGRVGRDQLRLMGSTASRGRWCRQDGQDLRCHQGAETWSRVLITQRPQHPDRGIKYALTPSDFVLCPFHGLCFLCGACRSSRWSKASKMPLPRSGPSPGVPTYWQWAARTQNCGSMMPGRTREPDSGGCLLFWDRVCLGQILVQRLNRKDPDPIWSIPSFSISLSHRHTLVTGQEGGTSDSSSWWGIAAACSLGMVISYGQNVSG